MAEKELVDKLELQFTIFGLIDEFEKVGCVKRELCKAIENAINSAPTIDAVAVVKCGECQFKDTEDCPMSELVDENYTWITDPKAQYCSYGKAKEGDDGK